MCAYWSMCANKNEYGMFKGSLSFSGVLIWNSIPIDIKNSSSLHICSKLLWWFFLFNVLVFNIFLCCWSPTYVFIFLVKLG